MLQNSVHPISHLSGSLSAGYGAEAFDENDKLDLNYLVTGGKYGCKSYVITGDSAIPYLPHGSVVVVDPTAEPRNGSVIAACRNGLNHIKILRLRPRLQLVSPNTKYEPIEVTELDDFHILGVVEGFGGRMPHIPIKEDAIYSLTELAPTGDGGVFKVVFDGEHDSLVVRVLREDIVKGVKLAAIALKDKVMNTLPFVKPKIDRKKVAAAIENMKPKERPEEFYF